MKRFLSVLFLTLLSHLFLFATQSLGKLDFLRCEYLVTPLGVDVPTPRFSWRLPAHLNKQQVSNGNRAYPKSNYLSSYASPLILFQNEIRHLYSYY